MTNNKIIIYLIILLEFSYSSFIKDIVITGNNKTRTSTIINEIQHPINSNFDIDIAKQDQQRLFQLECFDEVTISMQDSIYHIYLKEKPLLTLFPVIDKEDGLGWSGGIMINFNNIKGNADRIHNKLTLGAKNTYQFDYIDNRIGKTEKKLIINYFNQYYSDIESQYKISNHTMIFNFLHNDNLKFFIKGSKNKLYESSHSIKKYKYITPSLSYTNKYSHIYTKQTLHLKYEYNFSLYNYYDYAKLYFELNNNLKLSKYPSTSTLDFNIKINLNSESNSPIYEYLYLGGDKLVRGYEPNPVLNNEDVHQKLKFLNFIIHTMQINIPIAFKSSNYLFKKTSNNNLFFYMDYGLGTDDIKHFEFNNKIKGYGFGIKLEALESKFLHLAVGLNPYGHKILHIYVDSDIK